MDIATAIGRIWADDFIQQVFNRICDTGGRLAGSASEGLASEVISDVLRDFPGVQYEQVFEFRGFRPKGAFIRINMESPLKTPVCLPGSPPMRERLLEVVDMGEGAEKDFEASCNSVHDKAVLVRHEYPFTLQHIHRWSKYEWAQQAGAAAFIIVNNIPDTGPVTGGVNVSGHDDLPAIGVSYEDGVRLANASLSGAKVSVAVSSDETTWSAKNQFLDIPGREDRYVLVCAHVDGHNLAESAMDNATGLAAVLELGRVLSPLISQYRYGLRLAFFSVEEWGIEGSNRYVDSLPGAERDRIVCAIALDSITGSARMAALTGGSDMMENLVAGYSRKTGIPIDIIRPRLPNSDHIRFQDAGIAAMRMIAGYGDHSSKTRYLLTAADRREIVDMSELKAASTIAAGLIDAACSSRDAALSGGLPAKSASG